MIHLKQRGDTLVEVLIAILVLVFMLTGAFASARRSSTQTRQSQERIEGLKTAEEQVEMLKVLAVTDKINLNDPSVAKNYFCIDRSGIRRESGGSLQPLATDNFSSANYYMDPTPANTCPRQPAGGVTYYPAIVRDLATHTFYIHVRWLKAGGGSNEEVILNYRIYP